MASYSLTLDQLRNITYPENSPQRVLQKAQEDKAVGTFVDAMKKFDYANANAQNRQVDLEVAKITDRTGVPVKFESSFWNKGALVFPKDMNESSVKAALQKITTKGETLPIDGDQEEGYSVAVSDLASAAPDLVNEAKAEQQKEVIDCKAAMTEAANKTLQAHGWDLTGNNHRWQKANADSLAQTTEAIPTSSVTASAINPPVAEINTASSYALGVSHPVVSKPVALGVENTVVAKTLPEKTQHLTHRAQLAAQNAKAVAEIRELVEKTRQAALESASASKDVIQSLNAVNTDVAVAKNSETL
jgi:hypothetical protein